MIHATTISSYDNVASSVTFPVTGNSVTSSVTSPTLSNTTVAQNRVKCQTEVTNIVVSSTASNPMFGNTSEINGQDRYRSKIITASAGIKITVHVPKNVTETVRQRKINKIYDILSPKTSL